MDRSRAIWSAIHVLFIRILCVSPPRPPKRMSYLNSAAAKPILFAIWLIPATDLALGIAKTRFLGCLGVNHSQFPYVFQKIQVLPFQPKFYQNPPQPDFRKSEQVIREIFFEKNAIEFGLGFQRVFLWWPFHFSGSQGPEDSEKIWAGRVFCDNTGELWIINPKQPKSVFVLFRGANRSSGLIR
mgnify:CR=1 FL=1